MKALLVRFAVWFFSQIVVGLSQDAFSKQTQRNDITIMYQLNTLSVYCILTSHVKSTQTDT